MPLNVWTLSSRNRDTSYIRTLPNSASPRPQPVRFPRLPQPPHLTDEREQRPVVRLAGEFLRRSRSGSGAMRSADAPARRCCSGVGPLAGTSPLNLAEEMLLASRPSVQSFASTPPRSPTPRSPGGLSDEACSGPSMFLDSTNLPGTQITARDLARPEMLDRNVVEFVAEVPRAEQIQPFGSSPEVGDAEPAHHHLHPLLELGIGDRLA